MRSLLILSFFGISHAFKPADETALQQMLYACVADDNTGATCYACVDGSHANAANATCTDNSIPTLVTNWDTSGITTLEYMFRSSSSTSFNYWTTSLTGWDTSKVTTLRGAFRDGTGHTRVGGPGFNADISTWDTSSVTTTYEAFKNNLAFNGDLPWNTSSVTNIGYMFQDSGYNKPLNWDTSSVVQMGYMFERSPFDQSLNHWDFSSVTRLERMLASTDYNQPIDWNTGSCTSFSSMFYRSSFNQPINLDFSSATSLHSMFKEASKFNQPIDWDTSSVTTFEFMLSETDFDSELKLKVDSVIRMNSMFYKSNYNGKEVQDWDTSSVTSMGSMFAYTPFSQNLEMWDVSNVRDFSYMFQQTQVNYNFNCWDMRAANTISSMFSGSAMSNQQENYAIKKALANFQSYPNIGWSNTNSLSTGPDPVPYCGGTGKTCGDHSDCISASCTGTCDPDTVGMTCPETTCNAITSCENNICVGGFKPNTLAELKAAVNTCLDATASGACAMLDENVPKGQGAGVYGPWNSWDISQVTSLDSLFRNRKGFTQDISTWDVGHIKIIDSLFYGTDFNWNISTWDISSATTMDYIFRDSTFNGDISQWNTQSVTRMNSVFYASQFNGDISKWDTSSVTTMREAFASSKFNQDIGQWDVSKVTDMYHMFYNSDFNQASISCWNFKDNVNAQRMFEKAAFDKVFCPTLPKQDFGYVTDVFDSTHWSIETNDAGGTWGTCNLRCKREDDACTQNSQCESNLCENSKCTAKTLGEACQSENDCTGTEKCTNNVCTYRQEISNLAHAKLLLDECAPENTFTDGSACYGCAHGINQGPCETGYSYTTGTFISDWDVSAVTSLDSLFRMRKGFNQDISNWDTSNVITMKSTFNRAETFNQDLHWDTSKVTTLSQMFYEAYKFNGKLPNFDTSSVTDMMRMFMQAGDFSQDVSHFDTSKVTMMYGLFYGTKIDQDLSSWDVSQVTDMYAMFYGTPMNQDLSCWDVSSVTRFKNAFKNAETDQTFCWDISSSTDSATDIDAAWDVKSPATLTIDGACSASGCVLNGEVCTSDSDCRSALCENSVCNQYCLVNEKVASKKCTACEAGKTNAAADSALVDSECDATLCLANQKVTNNVCENCPTGRFKDQGDDSSGANTLCNAIPCEVGFKVVNNACTACTKGKSRPAGDDPDGADTTCTPIICNENEHVQNKTCKACASGFRLAGDSAFGSDTSCVSTTSGENCATDANCVNTEICDNGKCAKVPCLENQHVQGGACVACAQYANPAGDDPNGPNTECRLRGPCGGLTCTRGTCVNDVCACPEGYSGMTCSRDVTAVGQAAFLKTKRKALPTREDIKQTQKDIRTFVRDTLKKALLTKTVKQAVRDTKMAVERSDLKQKARVVVLQLSKQPVVAVASENKDTTDTCDQGVNTARCAMLDIKDSPGEIVFLNTQEETGSWSVLNSGNKILSKQTRVSEDVYDMQCWNNTEWSQKVRFDTSADSDVYACNDHIILIGSQAAVCTDDTCKNGGTCAPGGYSFTCICAAGYTGDTCETVADITHCHQMDCSDYGGHKAGECTDCSVANCCNYATKTLFNSHCDTLSATEDYVAAKCCHRTYCL